MSIQFGRWNFAGRPLEAEFLRKAAACTAGYSCDYASEKTSGPVGMFFQAFLTTPECVEERQPLTSASGILMTWDGRLDNREELCRLLHLTATSDLIDAHIALAAYQQFGTGSFRSLLGDWAMALWDPTKNALFLARDFLGTRHLFYRFELLHGVTWSTVLDPLVQLRGRTFEICEPFVAGYLSSFAPAHLTPYSGILAVPPSTFVEITPGRATVHEYWRLDSSHRVRYAKDADYEEHFRQLFAEAIRRRLRASSAVLAELSGGMDSTSIVCVADELLREGKSTTPRVDTISYYDDNEPNWNERPYFQLVEAKRGRAGYHLDASPTEGAFVAQDDPSFLAMPGTDALVLARSRAFQQCLEASDSRVALSGIGGDEVTGGVPTALPELQDLLVSLRAAQFFRKLYQFGLVQRRPFLHLGFDTVEEFLPPSIRRVSADTRIAPWITRSFAARNRDVFSMDTERKTFLGPRPSFQESLLAFGRLRRVLATLQLNPIAHYRAAYPFLDRDLVAFLFGIPREQHVRPGERRSLLRRALSGIVPREILTRKRKAYVARYSATVIETAWPAIERLLRRSYTLEAGWVNEERLRGALAAARRGEIQHSIPLRRILALELWLQGMAGCGVFARFSRRPWTPCHNKACCTNRDSTRYGLNSQKIRRNTMKYTKPEIVEMDNPIDAIQTTSKIGVLQDAHPNPTGCSAYEADE